MIELYYSWYSICSEKVLVCLFEKGLDFDGHHIDLFDFAQAEPAYRAVNPNGSVPTLVDDGRTVFECTTINEYIDEAYPDPPLAPVEPLARAEMRNWVQRFQEIVFPAAGMLSQRHFIAGELRRRWSPEQLEAKIRSKVGGDKIEKQLRAVRTGFSDDELAAAAQRISGVLDGVEEVLSDGREWLTGAFSLAEAAAAPNIYRLTIIDRDDLLEARPHLLRWARRLLDRPSVKQTYDFAPSVRNAAA